MNNLKTDSPLTPLEAWRYLNHVLQDGQRTVLVFNGLRLKIEESPSWQHPALLFVTAQVDGHYCGAFVYAWHVLTKALVGICDTVELRSEEFIQKHGLILAYQTYAQSGQPNDGFGVYYRTFLFGVPKNDSQMDDQNGTDQRSTLIKCALFNHASACLKLFNDLVLCPTLAIRLALNNS